MLCLQNWDETRLKRINDIRRDGLGVCQPFLTWSEELSAADAGHGKLSSSFRRFTFMHFFAPNSTINQTHQRQCYTAGLPGSIRKDERRVRHISEAGTLRQNLQHGQRQRHLYYLGTRWMAAVTSAKETNRPGLRPYGGRCSTQRPLSSRRGKSEHEQRIVQEKDISTAW